MNWIDKMERKFRGRGIPNLTVYVIICYVVGYLLSYMNPSMLSMMSLDVSKILQGQIWRLVTWVIYPPSTGNFFLFVISILFFYYPVGTSLERTWGSFRYTLYIFSGLLFVLIAAPIPTNISTNSEPEIEKNGTSASPATAFARSVLPVPGGPTSSAPFGIDAPISVYF